MKWITIIAGVGLVLGSIFIPVFSGAHAANVYLRAADLLPRATISLAPQSAHIEEGSTFNVEVLLDTHQQSANTVELELAFPADKLSIIKPAGNKSIISVWLAPPSFSNSSGRARFVGVITNGIVTSSGLITEITFKAIASGEAVVKVLSSSQVLANDGLGSPFDVEYGRGDYTISPRPPEGVKVFSESHPFASAWYNNNNVVLGWEGEPSISDYSFELDNKPFTVPDDVTEGKSTATAYNKVGDGLWYFHIKARRRGVWGATTHFPIHIDTAPPAAFQPQVEILTAAILSRVFVSFFTTDALSGLDHYEVGVVDKEVSPTESPVFVQTDSPYQIPQEVSRNLRVIVRALDRAGNVRDEAVDIRAPEPLLVFFQRQPLLFTGIGALAFLILIIIGWFMRRQKRTPAQPPQEQTQGQIIEQNK